MNDKLPRDRSAGRAQPAGTKLSRAAATKSLTTKGRVAGVPGDNKRNKRG